MLLYGGNDAPNIVGVDELRRRVRLKMDEMMASSAEYIEDLRWQSVLEIEANPLFFFQKSAWMLMAKMERERK